MSQQITRINGKNLEKVAEKIFQERFIKVFYNDYSPICAMIGVDRQQNGMIDMESVKSLEYYGFKTTHIQDQGKAIVYYVYQKQDNRGHCI